MGTLYEVKDDGPGETVETGEGTHVYDDTGKVYTVGDLIVDCAHINDEDNNIIVSRMNSYIKM